VSLTLYTVEAEPAGFVTFYNTRFHTPSYKEPVAKLTILSKTASSLTSIEESPK
jgi:hypothetical protein